MNGSEHFDPGLGSRLTYVFHPSRVEVLVASFGHLHSDAPKADLLVDVRDHLRDPHVEPAFRALTGRDRVVVERVLATPGADALIDALVAVAAALLPVTTRSEREAERADRPTDRPTGLLVRVVVGCAGGRHRSVVIVDAVTARLALAGWGAQAEHLHIGAPVVAR